MQVKLYRDNTLISLRDFEQFHKILYLRVDGLQPFKDPRLLVGVTLCVCLLSETSNLFTQLLCSIGWFIQHAAHISCKNRILFIFLNTAGCVIVCIVHNECILCLRRTFGHTNPYQS